MLDNPALVELKGITKSFGRVTVLEGVDFSLRPGEVHALLGENGAGKSTLMNVLGGVIQPDKGEIRLRGRRVVFRHPAEAGQAGVSFVPQEIVLLPYLTVAQNIWLGREPRTRIGTLDHRRLNRQAKELLDQLGLAIDSQAVVADLSVAEEQLVQIAKALSVEAEVLVLDEPTASLTAQETERLFGFIRSLRERGVGIIYITHRLTEIFSIADRASFLKDGHYVGTRDVSTLTHDELVKLMVGRLPAAEDRKRRPPACPEPVLEVRELVRPGTSQAVSFSVNRGEIVGLTGLVGAGRTELARSIFGADRPVAGEVYLCGQRVTIGSPRDAIRAGMGFVTEDRKGQGLVACLPVLANASMAALSRFCRLGFIRRRSERTAVAQLAASLSVSADLNQRVGSLSGGNQQKVVLSKWLLRKPALLILDEPTRGIDVGARDEFYRIIRELAAGGAGVLLISSDLQEILRLSDRILVMHEAALVGEFKGGEATEERIFKATAGLRG